MNIIYFQNFAATKMKIYFLSEVINITYFQDFRAKKIKILFFCKVINIINFKIHFQTKEIKNIYVKLLIF